VTQFKIELDIFESGLLPRDNAPNEVCASNGVPLVGSWYKSELYQTIDHAPDNPRLKLNYDRHVE
jgi:hypothetical protein